MRRKLAWSVGVCALVVFVLGTVPQGVDAQRTPAQAASQAPPVGPESALEQLAHDAVVQIGARYSRPIGHVVERRRGRVFVVAEGAAPAPGTRLLASRPLEDSATQRVRWIATLEVERVKGGLLECKEVERTGRPHAENGDRVHEQRNPPRVLLAPCIAQVDVPGIVPQVIGEWIRAAMLGRMDLELLDDAERERAAEAAYWSGAVPEFLSGLRDVDEVLYPVLLQTPGKLVLNLEYFSSARQRAVHVDVAAVRHDDMTTAWLQAGRDHGPAPPGFRLLGTQVFPWRLTALARSARGMLLGVTRDSIHVLDFRYPGLRTRASIGLGARHRVRREPYTWVLSGASLGEGTPDANWVVSDERDPQAVLLVHEADGPRLELARDVDARTWFEAWWPASWGPLPLANRDGVERGSPRALEPVVGDLDGDGRADVTWTSTGGAVLVQRANASSRLSFRGYGDAKAVQPARGSGTRAVLWLSDPVCCGQPDRLHATQLVDDELRAAWSSAPRGGTIEAMASCDLNADDAYDLVVAEGAGSGTRLYVYLALPGEETPARGMELSNGASR